MIGSMKQWLEANLADAEYLFGRWDQVEIDEVHMRWTGHQPNWSWITSDSHQSDEGAWILGLINRAQHRCWLLCVEDRSKRPLIEPIKKLVAPGAVILTNALPTYSLLDTQNRHLVINKRVDGFARIQLDTAGHQPNVNVNHCEAMWSRVRELARTRCINTPADAQYLCIEFMYKFYHNHICETLNERRR